MKIRRSRSPRQLKNAAQYRTTRATIHKGGPCFELQPQNALHSVSAPLRAMFGRVAIVDERIQYVESHCAPEGEPESLPSRAFNRLALDNNEAALDALGEAFPGFEKKEIFLDIPRDQ